MSDRLAFIDAILADPADDTPRLVYADWLDEHGDALDQARAEFVRVQCELARLPADHPARPALGDRETALIDAHARAWLDRLPPTDDAHVHHLRNEPRGSEAGRRYARTVFRRGFLRGLEFYVQRFVVEVAPLATVEPISDLTLAFNLDQTPDVEDMGWVEELAACPHLRAVTKLDGPDSGFGPDRFAVLIRSPHLVNLHTIELFEDEIGPPGVRALVESPTPFRLRKLSLNGAIQVYETEETPDAVEAVRLIADSPKLATLDELELYYNGLGEGAVAALVRSAHLRPDLRLTFEENDPLPDHLQARLAGRFRLV